MTITPPIVEDDDEFNKLANRLARELSTAFGYALADAEQHIREFYHEYEARECGWTAVDYFFHDDSAVVLYLGYRLCGGDPHGTDYLEWRKLCWDPLKLGERVPSPDISSSSAD